MARGQGAETVEFTMRSFCPIEAERAASAKEVWQGRNGRVELGGKALRRMAGAGNLSCYDRTRALLMTPPHCSIGSGTRIRQCLNAVVIGSESQSILFSTIYAVEKGGYDSCINWGWRPLIVDRPSLGRFR